MNDRRQVVLASTSRYRRALLDRLPIRYIAAAPAYEEEHELALTLSPEDLVVELARRKAQSLGERFPGALIIGSDQVAELDGEILLKPGTAERAVAQLMRLAGHTHRLLTGVVVFEPRTGRVESALDIHRMKMRALTEAQARRYVALDDPVDCAGAYKAEEAGVALFSALQGRDFTAIVGLPLTQVTALLWRFGVDVLE